MKGMWPKAFAQLIELAPHISRLLPVADRFLQSKNAADEGSRRALEAMAEGLRGDLAEFAGAQTTLGKQMDALSQKVATAGGDAQAARSAATGAASAAESVKEHLAGIETRFTAMETRLDRVGDRMRMSPVVLLLVLTTLILLACVITLLVLLVHRH